MSAPVFEARHPGIGRLAGFALLLAAVSWGLGAFAAWPWAASDPGGALVRVAIKHVAAFEHRAVARSKADLETLPRHMRPQSPERSRTGRRVESLLTLAVDGQPLLRRSYAPSGLRRDGPTFAYEEVPVLPGRHRLQVTLADGKAAGDSERPGRFSLERDVEIGPGQALLVEFSEDAGLTLRSP
jgi:hypothetical protein